MIREQAPGKLFIAGEYAVVQPGEPSVLVAVDRYVSVELTPASDQGSISSDQFGRAPLLWTRGADGVVIDQDHRPYDYVLAAITVVEQLAAERAVAGRFYDIRISSELDDVSGRKFGLGSSAAVTVATVRALNRFYELELTALEIYKLALIATVRVSPASSGGDLAASVFGGWIAYSAPDRAEVAAQTAIVGVQAMLDRAWPHLAVRRLPAPAHLRLIVGWTGHPASTERMVGDLQRAWPAGQAQSGQAQSDQAQSGQARSGQAQYRRFLADSRAAVESLIAALEGQDAAAAASAVRAARTALGDLSRHAGIQIETAQLAALCDIAQDAGAAAKSSGAGGGDCGIVLAGGDTDVHGMLARWEQNDIRHLAIEVHSSDEESEGDARIGTIPEPERSDP
ncbi:phosphomevalonate kinase [Microbacterium terrisoli]|uniref:phosphomevalonate kinase n=1 Tax=Microbacterium terrisoli TaxID=3242192 RepID=UPI002804A016|nr:phosphomevalonate kinase [Microbacterium protaetiae]